MKKEVLVSNKNFGNRNKSKTVNIKNHKFQIKHKKKFLLEDLTSENNM